LPQLIWDKALQRAVKKEDIQPPIKEPEIENNVNNEVVKPELVKTRKRRAVSNE